VPDAELPDRVERDSMGSVGVPASRYWGAQTQRSLEHFATGGVRFRWSRPLIGALGEVKAAAAAANRTLGLLDPEPADAIEAAAAEVAAGEWDEHFPLVVFQTGSGTQTNMNANEVVANRANELLGSPLGSRSPVHPNDHVNLGQSSNDIFPTAIHVAVALEIRDRLLPSVEGLCETIRERSERFGDVVKVGRTHLQDATPLTLGQEMGAWEAQLRGALERVRHACAGLEELAVGATAVGTGLNTHPDFAPLVCRYLQERTGIAFRPATNPFAAIAAHDALVEVSATLRGLAAVLWKVANDVRWLASGPRAGIGELLLPRNEPGSSIMPGKVNPTQAEAVLMVAVQVYGNDAAVAIAGAQGSFQLNVHIPVIAHNVLESVDLLSGVCQGFDRHCMRGIEPDLGRIEEHLSNDLMLVTALVPHIGYDAAAAIAHRADRDGLTLRDAAVAAGVDAADFDRWVDPAAMTGMPPGGSRRAPR
jgi:fumarate hydratase class II